MSTTRTTFQTITTRLYTDASDHSNARKREDRLADLNGYGRFGYVLTSTVVSPENDGITIIDTLALTESIGG